MDIYGYLGKHEFDGPKSGLAPTVDYGGITSGQSIHARGCGGKHGDLFGWNPQPATKWNPQMKQIHYKTRVYGG